MEAAEKQLTDESLSCMGIVRNHVVGQACAEPCDGQWISWVKEVLALNQIQVSEFACTVRTLLDMERGKHRNNFRATKFSKNFYV